MPRPRSDETKQEYLKRFMGATEAVSDFPDNKQRLAVAHSMWEKKNSTMGAIGKEHPWPRLYESNYIESGVVAYQDLGPCKICGDKMSCGVDSKGHGLCQPEGATILVKQEALAKMGKSLIGKPIVDLVHKDIPPSMIADGEADGIITDEYLNPTTGWRMIKFLVWSPEAQKHCEDPNFSVSCAYEPTDVDETGGEWHNVPFANEVLDGEMSHVALVASPRYEGARINRVLINSKGGKMSWRFWEKGARKNAAPLDPKKELVDVDGEQVPLENLYAASKEEEDAAKPKLNDDSVLEIDGKEKKLGELKQSYRNKLKKNADDKALEEKKNADLKCATCGQVKPAENLGKPGEETAPAAENAEAGAGEHREGGSAELKLPDLRASDEEAAAKKLDAETKEKAALELQQADDKAKADEAALADKKNAEDKAKEEMRQAEEKADKEKELANAKEVGRKSFEALRNARIEHLENDSQIVPLSMEDRLARGKSKYGSA